MFTSFILLFLLGIVSATFGSIVGLGGGIIIVPVLVQFGPYLLGMDISTKLAVGTSLTVLILTALSSSLSYMKQKKIDFKSAWLYFITSGPAAMLGASVTGDVEPHLFQVIFGFFMLFMAALLIAKNRLKPLRRNWSITRTYTDPKGTESTYGYDIVWALAIGFAVGFISGFLGIGGGSLFVPMMVLLFRYPAHVATATSMFVIFLSSILGSSIHIYLGEVHWYSVAALAPGAWIGGKFGAFIASRMSGDGLLWLLRVTLIVFAIRMIWTGMH